MIMERRHIEPENRRKNSYFLRIKSSLFQYSIQKLLAFYKALTPKNIAPNHIVLSINRKLIIVNNIVINNEVMIQLRKIIIHISRSQQAAKILSPIKKCIPSRSFDNIIRNKIAMECRLLGV